MSDVRSSTERTNGENQGPLQTILAPRLGIVVLVAYAAILAVVYFGDPHALLQRALRFHALASGHVSWFIALFFFRLAFLLPASIIILLSGILYGPIYGEFVAVTGLTLGGALEFLLLRSSLGIILRRRPVTLLEAWAQQINRAPFRTVLLMRIYFIPFDAVNIGAALARTPFSAFVFATLLGVIPTSLPIVLSGASVSFDAWLASGRLWPGTGVINWKYAIGAAVIATAIILNTRWLRRRTPGIRPR